MLRDGRGQSFHVIATLEQTDDTSLGGAVGGVHEDARRPAEIVLAEVDRGERIAPMRVEAA